MLTASLVDGVTTEVDGNGAALVRWPWSTDAARDSGGSLEPGSSHALGSAADDVTVQDLIPARLCAVRGRGWLEVSERAQGGELLYTSTVDGRGAAYVHGDGFGPEVHARWRGGAVLLESAASENRVQVFAGGLATALLSVVHRPSDPGGPRPTGPLLRVLDECARAGFMTHLSAVDGPGAGGVSAAGFQFHERLFHRRSRLTAADRLGIDFGATHAGSRTGPAPKLGICPARQYSPLPSGRVLADERLEDALHRRRSVREFDMDRVLSLSDIGALFDHTVRYMATGVNSRGCETARRAVPAASGLHELEVYLLSEHTELPRGLYHYDPYEHALGLVSDPKEPYHSRLLGVAGRLTSAHGAIPAMVVVTSRFDRIAWKYSSIGYALSLMHFGALIEAFQLVGASLGLGMCPVGTSPVDEFAEYAGLDPAVEASIGELTLGLRR